MSPAPALAVPGAHGDTLESRTGLGLGRNPQPVCCAPRALQGVGQHRAPTPRLAPASPRSEKAGEAGAVGTSPAAKLAAGSRARSRHVRPPFRLPRASPGLRAVRHRHIRHGTGRRPLRSASRAPRKPKPRKVNAGRRCPPGPAPGTRPAKHWERAGQVRARLLGGRGGLGLHAPGRRGRQRGQAAERALAQLVTATPSAHATATDGRGSVCESLALKLGCQGQRASLSTARSLLRAACGPCRHC